MTECILFLIDRFTGFATNDAVRAVVLSGAGDAFCSGADLQAMGGHDLVSGGARMKQLHGVILAIYMRHSALCDPQSGAHALAPASANPAAEFLCVAVA